MKTEEQGTKDKEEERRRRIFATESSHWYYHNAAPCHQILKQKKKKGDPDEYRNATIADARKMNLIPSVTNLIGKYSNKAGIEIWKRSVLLDSITPEMAQHLYLVGDDEEERERCFKEIADAADKETGKYAELGTLTHACIEKGVQMIIDGKDIGMVLVMCKEVCRDTGYESSASRMADIVAILQAKRFIHKGVTVVQEKGFAFNIRLSDDTEFGLAGKVDLLIEYSPQDVMAGRFPTIPEFAAFRALANERAAKGLPTRLLLDFKTRKPNRLKGGRVSFPSYSSDIAQLSGYAEGAKFAAGFKPDLCCNMLIASDALKDHDMLPCVEFREQSQRDIALAMNILKAMAGMWVAEEKISMADPYIPCIPDAI